MTPEMINNIIEINKKKAPMSFEEYYNKKLLEECKYFIENPKFSMKYMMVMAHYHTLRQKTLEEYNKKYGIVSNTNSSISALASTHVSTSTNTPVSALATPSNTPVSTTSASPDTSNVPDTDVVQPRRSQRLRNKNQNTF